MKPTSAIRVPRTQAVANPSAAIFVPSGRYGAFHRHQHLVFPCILGIHLPNSFLFLRKIGARCLRPCSGTAPCRNLTILRALWHNLFRDAVK